MLSNPYNGVRKVGTVGLPVSGAVAVTNRDTHEPCSVGETRELWFGPSVISGYLRPFVEQTANTFVGSWFKWRFGCARQGWYIRIAGRCKDLGLVVGSTFIL